LKMPVPRVLPVSFCLFPSPSWSPPLLQTSTAPAGGPSSGVPRTTRPTPAIRL
jgi:hypothetical protein